ncbi:MAG: GNAT family N-acetyltransferase [Anaerolineales bacterium]|nr:GNAT family N-acetyltransferase [Anaerolineales bacterium]
MTIDQSLYDGKLIRLGPIDHENDATVEARWWQTPEYLRMLGPDPAYPLSAAQLKKRYEAIEKEMEEDKNLFYFTIRSLEDDRLVGFARLYWIEWTHGNGNVQLGIGDPADRRKGYGSETLRLLLRFAFRELNLFRLSAQVPEYNQAALRLFEKAGFVTEVRRRQALQRYGRTWDIIHLGLMQEEWK